MIEFNQPGHQGRNQRSAEDVREKRRDQERQEVGVQGRARAENARNRNRLRAAQHFGERGEDTDDQRVRN